MKRSGLPLADFPGDDKPELSVLIGSNYYLEVVAGWIVIDREPGSIGEHYWMGSAGPSGSVQHDRDHLYAYSAQRGYTN